MSIDLLSLMIELQKTGYIISFLTNSKKGVLHQRLEEAGIKTYTTEFVKNNLFYLKHAKYLARFTKEHKVDIVYSHVQVSNFIATLAQNFSSSTFYMCRHHSDYVWNGKNKSAKLMDKFINRFAKNIVAISDRVYNQMVKVEKVKKYKIKRINLGYDFNLYPKPSLTEVTKIKKAFCTELLLLNIGRMIPLKRQIILIEACSILKKKGLNFKLIILGEGVLKNKIEKLIIQKNLLEHVYLTGYVDNVQDYILASDLIVHPSESEASSTIGKEVALLEKTLIACKEVGDFHIYINDDNGFLIPVKQTSKSLAIEIEESIKDKELLITKGKLLNEAVINNFSISNVVNSYKNLFR
jgi:glycosyltransferase involved in cell wall biosynthesis